MTTDPIVEAVRAKLHQRSQAGIAKYGTMLTRTNLSRLDWLRHLQEELLDGANYLEVLIQAEEKACAGDTATKSLRDMTEADFDAAHGAGGTAE